MTLAGACAIAVLGVAAVAIIVISSHLECALIVFTHLS